MPSRAKLAADVVIAIGATVATAGVAMIYTPAALILAGAAVAALGLFGIDVGGDE